MAVAVPNFTPGDIGTFYRIDERLQALHTKIVYLGIPGSGGANGKRAWWDLYGPQGGIQGVELMPGASGLMHVPFTQLISEGPYQVGAHHERVDWNKRDISVKVMVGVTKVLDDGTVQPDTVFRYRMVEQRWWDSWSATDDGYFGVFTRTHGWRFVRVRLAEEPKNAFELDPAAFGNNAAEYDMNFIAADPYWRKRQELRTWKNEGEGDGGIPQTPWEQLQELLEDVLTGIIPDAHKLIPGMEVGEGNIAIANRGTESAWPKFLVSAPGIIWIEDGPGGNMIQLPLLVPDDGVVLVDTDPTARTLTASKDPVDPLFYRIARNSQLLDFILGDILDTGLPVWRRFRGRFTTPWPARTTCRIKVRHSQGGGQITAIMPQRYGMSYS